MEINPKEIPQLLQDFMNYIVTIGGKSTKTADQYFLDLRLFFRYMKVYFGLVSDTSLSDLSAQSLNKISISDIDLAFIKKIKLTDIYQFLNYLSRDRERAQNSAATEHGISAASRARKIAAIRGFFNYLEKKVHLIEENPAKELEIPKRKKNMVHYLSLNESMKLLENISGRNQIRDYCIITLFLNCGLRVSELVGVNIRDFHEDMLRVTGKGNKERIVYLNDACMHAVEAYMLKRKTIEGVPAQHSNAFFLSSQKRRISTETVKWLVKKYCSHAGLDPKISVHKLRHTSATLMYRNGVDVRVLQEILGHKHLNTTQIYTHVDNEDMKTAARANPLSSVEMNSKNTKSED